MDDSDASREDVVGLVSGKKSTVSAKQRSAMPAATNAATVSPYGENKPPRTGPRMSPKLSAANVNPIPEILCSREVMSAMAARAVDVFPADAPSMIRARKSKGSVRATPRSRNPATVPATDSSKTGFLPYLSDRTPRGGPARIEKKGRVEEIRVQDYHAGGSAVSAARKPGGTSWCDLLSGS